METITSRHNVLVGTIRTLARGRDVSKRRSAGRLLLEGAHLVQEAISAGVHVEVAVVARRLLEGHSRENRANEARELQGRLAAAGSRVVAVSERVMEAMSPARTPSGILAIASYSPPPLEAALAARNSVPPLVLLLADVQDPGNLGAMIRTAEAADATGAVACGASADPFGWKALRGAMGSSLRLPVASSAAIRDAVDAARGRGLRIVATAPREARSLYDADFTPPTAILLGGEGSGLPRDVAGLADETVAIPMRPPVESLNVGVAAALILYEAYRQRAHV